MLLAWYYHFAAEVLLGSLIVLSTASGSLRATSDLRLDRVNEDLPRRMVVPWVDGWRDQYGIDEVIADALWGRGECSRRSDEY